MLEAFTCPSRTKETCFIDFSHPTPEIAAYVKEGDVSVYNYLSKSEWDQVFAEMGHFACKDFTFSGRTLFAIQSLCVLPELPSGWKVKAVISDEVDDAQTELTGNVHRNSLTYRGFGALKKLNDKAGVELVEDYAEIIFTKG